MYIKQFVVSPLQSNCYVVSVSQEPGAVAAVVDPGDDSLADVFHYIDEHQYRVESVWCTHGHFDHVLGVDTVRARYAVPAVLHADDLELWRKAHDQARKWLGQEHAPLADPDAFWADGDTISLGADEFVVWHTPGHSPGGVCLIGGTVALTGDTLFAGTIGRTDFPESNPSDMASSLRRLNAIQRSLIVYPGHMQSTTLEVERQTNPFLRNL